MRIFKRLAEWGGRVGKPVDELPGAEPVGSKPNVRLVDARDRERVKLLQEDPDEYFRRYPMPRFDF